MVFQPPDVFIDSPSRILIFIFLSKDNISIGFFEDFVFLIDLDMLGVPKIFVQKHGSQETK